jgi:AraC-like DNA-binding protein
MPAQDAKKSDRPAAHGSSGARASMCSHPERSELVSGAIRSCERADSEPSREAPLSSRPVPKARGSSSQTVSRETGSRAHETIPQFFVRGLADALELSQFEVSELLSAHGLDALAMGGRHAISVSKYERFVEAALDRTGEPALGLLLGERIGLAAFGIVGHLVAVARNLREAVGALLRHERLLGEGFQARLQEEGDRAWFELDVPSMSPRAARFHSELLLTALARVVKAHGSRDMGVRRILFEHGAPSYEHEYIRLFLGAERFGQPFTGLEIDRSLLDRDSMHKDAELFEILEAEARRREHRSARNLTHSERLKHYLVEHMNERPDMEAAARQLGMSSRSLRRRLTEEGASWNQITDDALGMLAKQMLDDPSSSVKETAYALGFSDPTSLYRAFKRWTGMTPKQYRAEH